MTITLGFEASQSYGSPSHHRTVVQVRLIPVVGAPFIAVAWYLELLAREITPLVLEGAG